MLESEDRIYVIIDTGVKYETEEQYIFAAGEVGISLDGDQLVLNFEAEEKYTIWDLTGARDYMGVRPQPAIPGAFRIGKGNIELSLARDKDIFNLMIEDRESQAKLNGSKLETDKIRGNKL